MIMLWEWGLRAPFAAVAILSLALSVAGVADWSLGAFGLAFGAVVASAANHLAARASARQAARLVETARNGRNNLDRERFENLARDKGRGKAA